MTVKMNGAMYKKFLSDKSIWSEDSYWDDVTITLNENQSDSSGIDLDEIKDADGVGITGGYVFLGEGKGLSAETFAKRWLKKQSVQKLVITCSSAAQANEVRKAVMAMGGKVH